ncbi:Homeobox protein HD-10 [Dictyocoela roeselum]|nr:Homeobox protein HD-10 [Dictyocoela roeselum]
MMQNNYFDEFHQNKDGTVEQGFCNPFVVKHRRRTSKLQLKVLEKTFETTVKPDASLRKALGEQLGMTPRAVQVWFQNRRAKVKKMSKNGTKVRKLGDIKITDIAGTNFPNAQENRLYKLDDSKSFNNMHVPKAGHPQMLRKEDIIKNMEMSQGPEVMFTPITPQDFARVESKDRSISPLQRGYYNMPDDEHPSYEYKLPSIDGLNTNWMEFNGRFEDEEPYYGNYGFYKQ